MTIDYLGQGKTTEENKECFRLSIEIATLNWQGRENDSAREISKE